jgi:hypothetical protein
VRPLARQLHRLTARHLIVDVRGSARTLAKRFPGVHAFSFLSTCPTFVLNFLSMDLA